MDRGFRPGPRFRETFLSVAAGAVFLLWGAQIAGSAIGLTRWEISDFTRGDTASRGSLGALFPGI